MLIFPQLWHNKGLTLKVLVRGRFAWERVWATEGRRRETGRLQSWLAGSERVSGRSMWYMRRGDAKYATKNKTTTINSHLNDLWAKNLTKKKKKKLQGICQNYNICSDFLKYFNGEISLSGWLDLKSWTAKREGKNSLFF